MEKMKFGLYINGQLVSSLSEPSPKLIKPWLIAVDVLCASSETTIVKAKSFVLRNLAK